MFRKLILASKYKSELKCNNKITFYHTDQKDFDGSQYVHGRSKGGAQVEAKTHSSSKLRAQ